VIRRSITELAYYLCYGPDDTPPTRISSASPARWAVKERFHTAKNAVGPDDYQVRRYDAWYRHITPAM
jgi:hypothetical protein